MVAAAQFKRGFAWCFLSLGPLARGETSFRDAYPESDELNLSRLAFAFCNRLRREGRKRSAEGFGIKLNNFAFVALLNGEVMRRGVLDRGRGEESKRLRDLMNLRELAQGSDALSIDDPSNRACRRLAGLKGREQPAFLHDSPRWPTRCIEFL